MPAAARARLPGRRTRPAGGGRAEIIARYPDCRTALLPLLHLVQSEEGHVTRTGIRFCAEHAGPDHGRGHRGRHLLLDVPAQAVAATTRSGVCTNTLCAVMGGDAIFDELKQHLGVGNGETTEDGKVTLEHIECNAACDFAPVVMVNWEFFDNQTAGVAPSGSSTTCARAATVEPDPRRPAVHVQGDRPDPGRLPRRAPRRRRGERRRGPRLAGRAAAGQGRGAPAPARGRAARRPRRRRRTSRARPSTSARTTRRRTPRPPTRTTRRDRSPRRASDDVGEPMTDGHRPEKLLAPVLSAFWDEPRVLDAGHLPAARGLRGPAQGARHGPGRRDRATSRTPACAAAAARASPPA